jgi:hypothetical protein
MGAIGCFLIVGAVGGCSQAGTNDSGSAKGAKESQRASTAEPTPMPETQVSLARRGGTVKRGSVRIGGRVDPPNARVRVEGRTVSVNT